MRDSTVCLDSNKEDGLENSEKNSKEILVTRAIQIFHARKWAG